MPCWVLRQAKDEQSSFCCCLHLPKKRGDLCSALTPTEYSLKGLIDKLLTAWKMREGKKPLPRARLLPGQNKVLEKKHPLESQVAPLTVSRLSKSLPSHFPALFGWWTKDGCDTSKRNLQIADPLKPTFVNTNKTSLDTRSSVQGIHSTRSPRGGKLLPKNSPLFKDLTWNLPPPSSSFPVWVN